MTNERQSRPVFFGAMITEGIVAFIWAAIAKSFFSSTPGLNEVMIQQKGNAAYVVIIISNSLLGEIGGALAILGVVAASITSGDTAFRGTRLLIADFMKYKYGPILNRIYIPAPIFLIGFGLTQIDFGIVWRYFAWTNQAVAVVILWTITAYLIREKKFYWISLIPPVFMTAVVVSYILVAPEGFRLSRELSYIAISNHPGSC